MAAKKRSSRFFYVLRLAIGIALLVALFSTIDLEETGRLFRNIRLDWIAAAIGIIALLRVVMSLRWKCVLTSQKSEVPFLELLRITWIGTFFGHFLPGGVGIDLIRGYELVRRESRAAEVATTLILDRFIGVWSMFAVALVGAVIAAPSGQLTGIVPPLVLIQFLFLLGWFLAGALAKRWSAPIDPGHRRAARIRAKLIGMAHSFTDAGRMRAIFPTVAGLALGTQLFRGLLFFCIYNAFAADVSALDCIALIPIVSLITLIPISIAGLGVREGALVVLFRIVGVPDEISVSVGLVSHLLHVLVTAPGALLWLSQGNRIGHSSE
jgi:uncharacterized protein (TIRG00374 family)